MIIRTFIFLNLALNTDNGRWTRKICRNEQAVLWNVRWLVSFVMFLRCEWWIHVLSEMWWIISKLSCSVHGPVVKNVSLNLCFPRKLLTNIMFCFDDLLLDWYYSVRAQLIFYFPQIMMLILRRLYPHIFYKVSEPFVF